MTPDDALKLVAFDAEDLAVLSAHVQDGLVLVGDMAYLPRERRFVLAISRFDWEAAGAGRTERVKCGLHFEKVTHVATAGLRRDSPEAVLNLLSVTFTPGADAPSGEVTLIFSAGAAVRLAVECIEAQLRDIGPRWTVAARPDHPLDETDGVA